MARVLAAVPLALASVWALRLILGPWAAALLLAPVLVAVVVAGWALLDRALFASPPPPPKRTGPVVDVPARVRRGVPEAREATWRRS